MGDFMFREGKAKLQARADAIADTGAAVFREFGVALELLPPDAPADDASLDLLAERLAEVARAGHRGADLLPRADAWHWPPRRLAPPPRRPFDWQRDRWSW